MRRICLKGLPPLLLAAGLFIVLAAPAGAEDLTYDFEAEVPEAWSEDDTHQVTGQSQVLGPFNQRNDDYPNKASLSIGKELQGRPLKVEFDLVLLGNWDSQGSKADSFTVEDGDGNELLKVEQFPCDLTDKDENLPEGTPGATKVGKRYMRHCVLHKSFVLPAGAEEIVFKGKTTGRRSEFWALDNVRLTAG
jgi:hypothetical protein